LSLLRLDANSELAPLARDLDVRRRSAAPEVQVEARFADLKPGDFRLAEPVREGRAANYKLASRGVGREAEGGLQQEGERACRPCLGAAGDWIAHGFWVAFAREAGEDFWEAVAGEAGRGLVDPGEDA